MKRQKRHHLASTLLVLSVAAPVSAQQAARDWAPLAASLAPGTRVELDLADGTHIEGTVLGQEGTRFVFNPRTRIPVAPWRIEYSEIRSLEPKRQSDGMRPGTKVLVGIATGIGVTLLVGLLAVAASY